MPFFKTCLKISLIVKNSVFAYINILTLSKGAVRVLEHAPEIDAEIKVIIKDYSPIKRFSDNLYNYFVSFLFY